MTRKSLEAIKKIWQQKEVTFFVTHNCHVIEERLKAHEDTRLVDIELLRGKGWHRIELIITKLLTLE